MRGVFDLPDTTFGGSLPRADDPYTADVPANAFGAGTTVIPEIVA